MEGSGVEIGGLGDWEDGMMGDGCMVEYLWANSTVTDWEFLLGKY